MEKDNAAAEGRMERKKREVRQKIIQVAIALFNQQGFDNTTMEQIAEAADVARKTLYNYFPVKEAIADAYIREISMGLAQETFESLQRLPDTRSRLLAALNNSYGWAEKNPELTGIAFGYRMKVTYILPRSEQQETGTQRVIAAIIRQGLETGEIRADLSIQQMLMHIELLRGAVTMDWLSDPSYYVLHEEIAKMVDLVLYGISTRR